MGKRRHSVGLSDTSSVLTNTDELHQILTFTLSENTHTLLSPECTMKWTSLRHTIKFYTVIPLLNSAELISRQHLEWKKSNAVAMHTLGNRDVELTPGHWATRTVTRGTGLILRQCKRTDKSKWQGVLGGEAWALGKIQTNASSSVWNFRLLLPI